jgi:hypothetical protein
MDVPLNKTFMRQNEKLLPSTYKKGIITRVYDKASVADVQIIGTSQTVLKRIPLASHIDPLDVQVGNKCRVDQFDESNTSDMIVAYIYGAAFQGPKFASGTFMLSGSSSANVIPHGLGVVPDFYGFNAMQDPASPTKLVYAYQAIDAQNIYYKFSANGTLNIAWYAVKL